MPLHDIPTTGVFNTATTNTTTNANYTTITTAASGGTIRWSDWNQVFAVNIDQNEYDTVWAPSPDLIMWALADPQPEEPQEIEGEALLEYMRVAGLTDGGGQND